MITYKNINQEFFGAYKNKVASYAENEFKISLCSQIISVLLIVIASIGCFFLGDKVSIDNNLSQSAVGIFIGYVAASIIGFWFVKNSLASIIAINWTRKIYSNFKTLVKILDSGTVHDSVERFYVRILLNISECYKTNPVKAREVLEESNSILSEYYKTKSFRDYIFENKNSHSLSQLKSRQSEIINCLATKGTMSSPDRVFLTHSISDIESEIQRAESRDQELILLELKCKLLSDLLLNLSKTAIEDSTLIDETDNNSLENIIKTRAAKEQAVQELSIRN